MTLTSNEKGARCEGAVLSVLLHAGYNVLVPFGVARYDLVIEVGGEFKRVQCKTARLSRRGSAIEFNASSRPPGRPTKSYAGQIDYFGVYWPAKSQVFLVPIKDLGDVKDLVTLRLVPARNGQQQRTRSAADYLLDPMASSSEDRASAS